MNVLLIALLFLRILFSTQQTTWPLELLAPLHQSCISYITQQNLPPYYQSIICGASITEENSWIFKHVGLYHLLVVSGAHIVFLENILNMLPLSNKIKFTVLIFYASCCQWNPPVCRALVQLFVQKSNLNFKLHLKSPDTVLTSGLICLLLFPEWLMSFSLLLSWSAALMMGSFKKPFWRGVALYLVTLPFIACYSQQSYFSIIYNLALAPLFAFVLFPLSLFTFYLPYINLLIAQLWYYFVMALEFLPTPQLVSQTPQTLSPFQAWVYVFALQAVLLYKDRICR